MYCYQRFLKVGSKWHNPHLFTLSTWMPECTMTEQPSDRRQADTHYMVFFTCIVHLQNVRGSRSILQSSHAVFDELWALYSPHFVATTCHTDVHHASFSERIHALSYLRGVCQLWPATYLGANWQRLIFIARNYTLQMNVYCIWSLYMVWSNNIKKKCLYGPSVYFVGL